MNRTALALSASLLLASSGALAMKKGTVKFFNEAKGFGFLVNVVNHFAEGTTVGLDGAALAVKKGLNAVNVKLARSAAPEVDGLGLYAIVHEAGEKGPDKATSVFTVRQDDFVDFVFEMSAAAASRHNGEVVTPAYDAATFPEFQGLPVQLEFEWPRGLPDGGNLVVQVRLPIAAFSEKVTVRGWDPRFVGAAFPDPTLDFLANADHVALADQAGLPADAFADWVAGTSLTQAELVDAIATGAKLTKADSGRIADALTAPIPAAQQWDSPSGLGVFRATTLPDLDARDPVSGKTTHLGARKVAKFKAGTELATSVNKGK